MLGFCSCTVLEDRSHCPCILEVDLTDVETMANKPSAVELRIADASGLELYRDEASANSYGVIREYGVPRGMVSVAAFSKTDVLQENGTSLLLPCGYQMDELFARSASIECSEETNRDYVVLHKQYSTVYLDFGPSNDYVASSFELEAYGGFAGMDEFSLSPISGDFTCGVEQMSDGGFSFRVPRQGDESLQLSLLRNGEEFSSIPLGEKIAEAGFDWDSEDLDDIWVIIDLPTMDVTVKVLSWERVDIADVVL